MIIKIYKTVLLFTQCFFSCFTIFIHLAPQPIFLCEMWKHAAKKFLRSVRRLLVAASVVSSSPILVTLMKEALSRFLQEPHGVTSRRHHSSVIGTFISDQSFLSAVHRSFPLFAIHHKLNVKTNDVSSRSLIRTRIQDSTPGTIVYLRNYRIYISKNVGALRRRCNLLSECFFNTLTT
jgi:hypothetical protein